MARETRREARRAQRRKKKPDLEGYVPSGCSILDLSCTNRTGAGYRPGTVVNIVGDEHTGKTLLALSCLAMCAHMNLTHELKYYNTESDIGFDIPALFGDKLAERLNHVRLHPPYCVEEWRDNMIDEAREERPRVVVVDSLDAMTSEDEVNQQNKEKKARQEGRNVTGSYGTSKAIISSSMLRHITGLWEQNNHILILVSQTRDKIGDQFGRKTRSGGKALDFYAYHIMWLHHAGKIKKSVRNNEIDVGNTTRVLLSKNKETGIQSKFNFNSYPDYGLDDTESMVNFLVKWKVWSKNKSGIIKPDKIEGLDEGYTGDVVGQIEEKDKLEELQELVQKEWNVLRERASPNRKRRGRFE